jgi:hypothetical protein
MQGTQMPRHFNDAFRNSVYAWFHKVRHDYIENQATQRQRDLQAHALLCVCVRLSLSLNNIVAHSVTGRSCDDVKQVATTLVLNRSGVKGLLCIRPILTLEKGRGF